MTLRVRTKESGINKTRIRSRVLASLLHYLFFTLWMVEFPLSPGRSAPDPEIVGFGLVLRLHRGEQKTPAAGALTSRDGSIG